MSKTKHQAAVMGFLEDAVPGYRVKGSLAQIVKRVCAIEAARCPEDPDREEDLWCELSPRVNYIPDGHAIDESESVIHWFEIDATHQTEKEKLSELAWANDNLQGFGWGIAMHLITMARGRIERHRVIRPDEFWPHAVN